MLHFQILQCVVVVVIDTRNQKNLFLVAATTAKTNDFSLNQNISIIESEYWFKHNKTFTCVGDLCVFLCISQSGVHTYQRL